MVRVLRISGDSMSPDYREGDFVVIATAPFLFHILKPGDVIAFEHGYYGLLIKRISRRGDATDEFIVEGVNSNSLDSRRLGPVRLDAIRGRVIAHFPKPRRTTGAPS